MTKILTLLLITITSFNNEFISDFDKAVNNAYDKYYIVDEYTNNYYTIKLVSGLIDDEVRYGLLFYSDVPGDYYVKVLYNNKLFNLETNARKDISAVVLDLKSNDVFSIKVYNKYQNMQFLEKFQNIRIETKEELNNKTTIDGLGLGNEVSELHINNRVGINLLIYIALAFIIVVCGFIILYYYKKHRGMFASDVRSNNIFNFKEFLSTEFVPINNTPEQENITESQKDNEENVKTQSIYHSWKREEEESSGFDIKLYLSNLGYITDYKLASEEEKNHIMLELMKLRDEKKITKDDYLEETSELWKK